MAGKSSYYQHTSEPSHAMTAHVNPAYFMPGALADAQSMSRLHGRHSHGRKGVTKHGRHGGVHARRMHSPLPPMRDPFKHKGMGKIR